MSKIVCPDCNLEIEVRHINIDKSLAHCYECNQVFGIGEHNKTLRENIRFNQPEFTKIRFKRKKSYTLVEIPASSIDISQIGTTLINIAVLLGIKYFFNTQFPTMVVVLFIVLIIIQKIYFWSITQSNVEIKIDHKMLSVHRNSFGTNTQRIHVKDIKSFKDVPLKSRNSFGLRNIRIEGNRKEILVSVKLSEIERKWLVGELNSTLKQYKA